MISHVLTELKAFSINMSKQKLNTMTLISIDITVSEGGGG